MQKTKITETKDELLKAIKPLTFLLGLMGILDILYKNLIYFCYAFLLFILHWAILIYLALFLEIIERPHKSIFDIINAFHVFTEPFSIIIIMCVSFFSSEKSSNLLSQIAENDQILQKLGTNIDYTKLSKRVMLSYVIYVFILTSLFTIDYMILFVWTTQEVFLFTSWLVTLIYVTINTTCLMVLMFMIALIKVRFQLLNKHLSGIKTINIDYLLKETIPVKKNSEWIPVRQMIEMIKDLHDKYIQICLTLLKKMDIVNVIQIGSLVVSLTGYIYIVLGMLMDQEYIFNIIVYCLYWSVFKILRLCLMVYVFSDVCYEVSYILYKFNFLN